MKADLPLKVQAPAKVNLCLYVGRRRRDGLHELCSLFQSVSLVDELVLTAADAAADRDVVICPDVLEPNTVTLALERFRALSGWLGPPLRVTLHKRIPVAAGLGGGSADAAALLRAVNVLAGGPLSIGELREIGMAVGADVPSQIEPGLHLVTGAGEEVEALPAFDGYGIVLVTSTEGLSTAEVYREYDAGAGEKVAVARQGRDLSEVAERLRRGTSCRTMIGEVNELQDIVLRLRSGVRGAIESLRSAGALAARVTGSGPTVFGLFSSYEEAEAALPALAGSRVFAVRPVGAAAGRPLG